MGKTRLEAFSDGVIAIIITIMVLELKVPHGSDWEALLPLLPVFLSYVLSFVYLGIYWNNHHHMLHTVQRVSGGILWANLHLLFWLRSLCHRLDGRESFRRIADGTVWRGAADGRNRILELQNIIIAASGGKASLLAKAVGNDREGKISPLLYAIAIPAAFWNQWLADALYVLVAVIWLVPDQRIERIIAE